MDGERGNGGQQFGQTVEAVDNLKEKVKQLFDFHNVDDAHTRLRLLERSCETCKDWREKIFVKWRSDMESTLEKINNRCDQAEKRQDKTDMKFVYILFAIGGGFFGLDKAWPVIVRFFTG